MSSTTSSEVYQLVERRRHFLSLIYAMAIIATFQLCLSAGWYSYLSEAYYHLAYNSEHFFHCFFIFAHFVAICVLYTTMFVRKNITLGFLVALYFIVFSLKLIQIGTMYPDVRRRKKFFPALRHSEYDTASLIHDAFTVVISLINLSVAACAAFHFTPLVILSVKEEPPMINRKLVATQKQENGSILVMKSSKSQMSSSIVEDKDAKMKVSLKGN